MLLPKGTGSDLGLGVQEFLDAEHPLLRVIETPGEAPRERMRREVLMGLEHPERPQVPATYFYDHAGSQVYEAITRLPEYYPTRTEACLLRQIAPQLAEKVDAREIVELGSGSSEKTRLLFEAFHGGRRLLTYVPIDVSVSLLRQVAEQLVGEYPGMRVLGLAAQFDEALAMLPPCGDRFVLFLGGTLGNLSPQAQEGFFAGLRRSMLPGSRLLLGFDRRVHAGKPESVVHAAYDDAQGVTARFNLNLLVRLNRELGADFDLSCWEHRARYNPLAHQIEMVLESRCDQTVRVAGRTYPFREGEGILTEISRKFDPWELSGWLAERGFATDSFWTDEQEYYGLLLVERTP